MTERDSQQSPSGDQPTENDDIEVTSEPGGLGQDGTIPPDPNGIAAGHTGTASTFEPEEDEKA
jgi:hypothetical protein